MRQFRPFRQFRHPQLRHPTVDIYRWLGVKQGVTEALPQPHERFRCCLKAVYCLLQCTNLPLSSWLGSRIEHQMYQSKIQSIRHSTALNRSLNRFHGFEANFSDTLVLGTYGRAVRSNMHSQCTVTFISFQNAFAARMCVCAFINFSTALLRLLILVQRHLSPHTSRPCVGALVPSCYDIIAL